MFTSQICLLLFILFLLVAKNSAVPQPQKYSMALRQGMFPDSYISLVQQMNAHQKEIYVQMYKDFVTRGDISGFLRELRIKLPDIYAKLAPLILESVERGGRMSSEANEFFAFYGSKSGKLQSGTDAEITAFLREILPKWSSLDKKSKEDFVREYPKLATFLNDKKVHKLAGVEMK